jgi:hypothetical protein
MMRVDCGGGCGKFVTFEDATPATVYRCAGCSVTDASPAPEVHFQKFAFDPDLNSSADPNVHSHRTGYTRPKKRGSWELKAFIDGSDWGKMFGANGSGFQIKSIRTGYEKDIPEQLASNTEIQKILLTAFPKLQTNTNQRQKAGRWAQVIKLHFQMGWSYPTIAEEMGVDPNVIKMIIRGIKYTLDGKTWNGTPRKRV